jgi:2-desacetyl-2-hydroxyethyl bacteriochlorophyllide A dehydrogenase
VTDDERTARGLWFRAPHVVAVEAVELPEPGPDEVLVKTAFSGISAGTELLAYRGQIDPALPLDEKLGALGGTFRYPFRFGYSCVGTAEIGRDHLAEGALVFAFQPHQDRFVARVSDVVDVSGVDARIATLFPFVETALQISLDAGAVAHERVVVFGLGVVGLLTGVLLQRAGAEVIGVEPLSWRRDVASRLGVAAVAPDEVGTAVAADGVGVPLVVEASGNPSALTSALPLLAHEGTALVASWYGTKPVALPLGAEFHRRRLTVRSTQVSTIPARLGARWTVARRRARAVALLGELELDAVATHVYPFAAAAEAFAALDRGEQGLVHAALTYGGAHVPGRQRD